MILTFFVRERDELAGVGGATQIPGGNQVETLQSLGVVLLAPTGQGSEFLKGTDQRPAFSSAEPSPLHPEKEHAYLDRRLRRSITRCLEHARQRADGGNSSWRGPTCWRTWCGTDLHSSHHAASLRGRRCSAAAAGCRARREEE